MAALTLHAFVQSSMALSVPRSGINAGWIVSGRLAAAARESYRASESRYSYALFLGHRSAGGFSGDAVRRARQDICYKRGPAAPEPHHGQYFAALQYGNMARCRRGSGTG